MGPSTNTNTWLEKKTVQCRGFGLSKKLLMPSYVQRPAHTHIVERKLNIDAT